MNVRKEQLSENVTLYCGDCREALFEVATVDAVLTDPPYKLSQAYTASVDADNLDAVSSIWPVAQVLREAIKPGGLAVVFYDTRILPLCLNAFQHYGWRYLRALTLYRRWGQASVVHGWMSTSDFALVFADPGAKPAFHGPVRHDTFVKAMAEPEGFDHPVQKPFDLTSDIVQNICPLGGIILDPYMGSGTTGAASVRNGRGFIGIEKESAHFDTACRRISDELRRPRLFAEPVAKPVQEALFG